MSESIAPIRVLLVDDESEFLQSTAKALGRRGFEVVTAPDGVAALDALERHEVDVVVLDVKMPGPDGEQVFREIHRRWPELPVVMLTGHGSVQQAFRTSKEGIFDYLGKPCEIEDLAALLRRAAGEEAAVDQQRQIREIRDRQPD